MRPSNATVSAAVGITVLDVVVAVEAYRTERPLVGTLAALAAVAAAGLAARARRPGVALRPDLADWLARTAAATGEPERHLLDRALARHRSALDAGGPVRG